MTRRYRSVARHTVSSLFVAAIAGYVWVRRDELGQAFDASWSDVTVLLALVVVGHALNATELWLMYRADRVPVRFVEFLALFSAGQLGNYLPFQVGTAYRFRYLRAVHGVRYAASASTAVMNLLITLASTAVCGLAGVLGVAALDGEGLSWVLLLVFALLALVAVGIVLTPLTAGSGSPGRVQSTWREFHRGWESLRTQPAVGLQVLVIDVVKLFLLAVRFQLAFSLLGISGTYWVFLVIGPVAALVSVVAPTPGALGIREAAVGLAAAALGWSVPDGVLAATVDRGVMLAVTVVSGSAGYVWTRRLATGARSRRPGPDAGGAGPGAPEPAELRGRPPRGSPSAGR